MSRYGIVPADAETRLTPTTLEELTDGAGAPDDAVIEAAIDAEENDFDGFAGVYYALPVRDSLAAVVGITKERILDGVAIRLLLRKPEFMADGSELAKVWQPKIIEVRDWKRGLSDPKRPVRIPNAVEKTSVATTAGAAAQTSDDMTYTGDSMAGWS